MLGQAHLQHYTELSAEPIPTTALSLQSTILPLGPGTFTHNAAGVPIVVACIKTDLIDENNDLVDASVSGMGGMVKGKGGEWEECTDGIMQILHTICLKCTSPSCTFLSDDTNIPEDGASLFHTTPQPTTLQGLRQHALHLLFTLPAPPPDKPAALIRHPFPFARRQNTLDRDRIVVPARNTPETHHDADLAIM